MKYLCLVYANEQELHSSPDSPHDSECFAYANAVQESGRMLAAEALQSVQTATTVRMRGGKLAITDGPFAETKEQLAGFYLVEARDLNEAIQLADSQGEKRRALTLLTTLRSEWKETMLTLAGVTATPCFALLAGIFGYRTGKKQGRD